MNSMNVDFSAVKLAPERVWYDVPSGRLCISAGDYQNSIDLFAIPDRDFESTAPVIRFSIGQTGSVVVCHHRDGAETWLPVDLWLPGGFKPKD
jgi:hypothetical protein